MNAAHLLEDIQSGALVEVEAAKDHFYDDVRGLTVRQSFWVYPDDSVACLSCADGSYSATKLTGDDHVIFMSRYGVHLFA